MSLEDDPVQEIARRLELRYPAEKGWSFFSELRDCTGWSHSRTIDVWAMNTWPSSKLYVAIEIKTSVSDFRRENPMKRAPFLLAANEFWYAAPRGVIPIEELPRDCGLLETWGNDAMRATKRAPQRDAAKPDEEMFMAICRKAAEHTERLRQRFGSDGFAQVLGRDVSYSELKSLAEKCAPYSTREELLRLKHAHQYLLTDKKARGEWWGKWKKVVESAQRFVAASGSTVNQWRMQPEDVLAGLEVERASLDVLKLAKMLRDAADKIDGGVHD